MNRLEKLLEEVRAYLPPPGTELGSYTFLTPDTLWTGKMYGQPFVSVAEDRWHVPGTGQFLAVLDLDGVYAADLKDRSILNYCSASFPWFMKIMNLYQAALEAVPGPESVFDEAGYRRLEEAERILREQVSAIDPTALAKENYFWSTWIEEFGYGL